MKSLHNLVFPGQGSQRPGMGSDFYENFPQSKEIFSRASAALGEDIPAICFPENPKLDLTEYTQPCILTCSIAILESFREELTLDSALFAGHSLGEYTALVAAGVFQLEDAVKIVRKRGALMQQAVPAGEGVMAALIAEDLQNLPYRDIVLAAGAEIANVNSPEQTVISGRKTAVEQAITALEEKLPQIQVLQLNVSAPFHSSLMKPAETEFREYLTGFSKSINFKNAGRVASNVSGKLHSETTLIDDLVAQISAPVRWLDNMQLLIQSNNPVLEIGPNKVLTRFFSAQGVKIKSVTNLKSMQSFCAPETA
jgi:trans-AT polyketide synthase, acyltransferase and oxidoreductase domains